MSESDDAIVQEAKDRLDLGLSWEGPSRNLFLDDLKFDAADTDNRYQWPDSILKTRDVDDKPCLTINKTQQHNFNIINDIKKHRPTVKVKPVGGDASYKSAQIYNAVIKHLEYQSNATVAYDTAMSFQVRGGIGYWRIVTDYVDADSFDQDIFIKEVQDPTAVLLDCDIQTKDGSDARWGFFFDDVPRDLFEKKYPGLVEYSGQDVLGTGNWFSKDTVRVAEYYRKIEKKDVLVSLDGVIVRKSVMPKETWDGIKDQPGLRKRPIVDESIEWFLIVGEKIAKRTKWPGKYIPIVRVVGTETVIQGKLDRKGQTRNLKDPQRIYNFWSSAAVEMVALQGKTPWVGPVDAIEELETYWRTANRINHAYLPYNPFDDEGRELPAPQRAQPPIMAQGYIQGMQIAKDEMMMASGQYEAMTGQASNERTGVAIEARQDQGETATFHFKDNFGVALRHCGRILIDLIPKIYDTERVKRCMAEDGTEMSVTMNPSAPQAVQQVNGIDAPLGDDEIMQLVFNPSVGKYDVEADFGPDYGTRRQEGKEALTNVITQAPEMASVIGDLLFKASDFPLANEVAARLRRMVPPQALGTGPPPEVAALQQQVQQLSELLKQAQDEYAKKDIALKGKVELRNIDVYKAESDRLKVLLGALTPEQAAVVVQDLLKDVIQTDLTPIIKANADDLTAMTNDSDGEPPVPGARKAPDGKYYIPDPTNPGSHLEVGPAGAPGGV